MVRVDVASRVQTGGVLVRDTELPGDMSDSVTEQDVDFLRRSTKLVVLWTTIFIVASLIMIFFGDFFMNLFT